MAPGEYHQVVPARTAKRLDYVQMVPAGTIERFRECVRVRPDSVNLLGQQVDRFDQAGIAAEAVQDPVKTERAYVLESGNVIMHGTSAELADNKQVQAAYLGI
jgi:hypothetical protein